MEELPSNEEPEGFKSRRWFVWTLIVMKFILLLTVFTMGIKTHYNLKNKVNTITALYAYYIIYLVIMIVYEFV